MELVGGEFLEVIDYFLKSWLPAKKIVEKAITTRHEVNEQREKEIDDERITEITFSPELLTKTLQASNHIMSKGPTFCQHFLS